MFCFEGLMNQAVMNKRQASPPIGDEFFMFPDDNVDVQEWHATAAKRTHKASDQNENIQVLNTSRRTREAPSNVNRGRTESRANTRSSSI